MKRKAQVMPVRKVSRVIFVPFRGAFQWFLNNFTLDCSKMPKIPKIPSNVPKGPDIGKQAFITSSATYFHASIWRLACRRLEYRGLPPSHRILTYLNTVFENVYAWSSWKSSVLVYAPWFTPSSDPLAVTLGSTALIKVICTKWVKLLHHQPAFETSKEYN